MRISHDEYLATAAKIAKINARAERKGFTGRIVLTGEVVEVERTTATGLKVTEEWVEASIDGEAPSYNGWTLAAVLDFDPEAGLIVNTAPGVDKVEREGLSAGTCAHCNTNRDRRKAYLVHNVATGEQVQVGSTCIKDFLGWSGSFAFISVEDVEREVEGGGFGGGDRRVAVEDALAIAWAAIKTHGWVPASSYEGTPTKHLVHDVIWTPSFLKPAEKARLDEIAAFASGQDTAALGAEVRAFILSDAFSGDSEYVRNLKALMAADHVGARHLGLVVSAPQAMFRAQERTLVEAAKASLPESKHFGTVGDKKVPFTGVIESIRYIEGNYGTTTLYTIRNQEDGRIVKWFASNDILGDRQGVEVSITGTIKAHDTYNGTESTVFTRCKAV